MRLLYTLPFLLVLAACSGTDKPETAATNTTAPTAAPIATFKEDTLLRADDPAPVEVKPNVFVFDWNEDKKPDTLIWDNQTPRFERLRIHISGMTPAVFPAKKTDTLTLATDLLSHKRFHFYKLLPDEPPFLLMQTPDYVEIPGNLIILRLVKGRPALVMNRTFQVYSVKDLDGNGTLELVGDMELAPGIDKAGIFTYYNPADVLTISLNKGALKFTRDEKLMEYNARKLENYPWYGPKPGPVLYKPHADSTARLITDEAEYTRLLQKHYPNGIDQ